MKKLIFFLPAILFSLIYGAAILSSAGSVMPPAYIWIALFIISGVLLMKGQWWGGLIGALPGIHMIYMSTVNTGQIINIELPLGIVVIIFELICCGYALKRSKGEHR